MNCSIPIQRSIKAFIIIYKYIQRIYACLLFFSEKESICPVCNKTFPTLPALNGHMRLHGGYDKEGKEQAFREKVLRNVHQQQPQMIDSPPSVASGNFSANVAAATLCGASAAVNLSQGKLLKKSPFLLAIRHHLKYCRKSFIKEKLREERERTHQICKSPAL